MRPPSAWIERLTTSMPTPRPEMSETVSAVEKPGRKIRLSISSSVSWASAAIRPLLDRRSADRARLMPAPSSETSMTIAARAVRGGQPDRAFGGLAGGGALLGRLEAVVDGVADHVRQRVGQPLDDRLVDLGVFALGDQADRLAGHVGDLAHDARHALEHRLHRLGADRHDAVLDLARQLLELVEARWRSPTRRASPVSITRCDSIAWLMTSSPTRLIRRSTRSRSTRMVALAGRRAAASPAASALAASGRVARGLCRRRLAAAIGSAAAGDRGGLARRGGCAAASSTVACRQRGIVGRRQRADAEAISRSQSPSTNSKTSRMALSSLSRRELDGPGQIGALGIELVERRAAPRCRRSTFTSPRRAELAQQQRGLVGLGVELARGRELDA